SYNDISTVLCRDVIALRVEAEITRSNREARLEQPLVDRPELPDGEATEIDRPRHAIGRVNEHRNESRPELGVRQPNGREGRAGWTDLQVRREETAVVCRNAALRVSLIDREPKSGILVP